jgi:hypothetical protein
MGEKVFLMAAIVAIVAMFIHSRRGSGSDRFKEKSMA